MDIDHIELRVHTFMTNLFLISIPTLCLSDGAQTIGYPGKGMGSWTPFHIIYQNKLTMNQKLKYKG